MRFEYAAALAALLMIIAPLAAHMLRLRRPQPRAFPPAALVPAAPPAARSRSRLEDKSLLVLRVIAIVTLALLGATPFVQCSRLAMGRQGGASIALVIVVDDSSSMRVLQGGRSRFETARAGASDLVAGMREGDSVGIILAGDPARVALVPTTDAAAAAAAVRELRVSDRATDLDGALSTAQDMVKALPQGDRRVVLLSDLADGRSDAPRLGDAVDTSLWVPRKGLDQPASNCALVRADRGDHHVIVHVVCSAGPAARNRDVVLSASGKPLARRALGSMDEERPSAKDLTIELPDGSAEPDEAALAGAADAIDQDDRAPVAPPMRGAVIAVVADAASSRVATGGPPPVEQALSALGALVTIRPLPSVPETMEELAPYAGLIVDDPPGLTPEAREAVRKWLEAGGVAMAALGPRAAAAPLGASLDPFVTGNVRWDTSAPAGLDPATASILGPSSESLTALHPTGRLIVDTTDSSNAVIRWSDGAPWLLKRPVGRGTAMALTMSLAPDESDLVVRPGFLALLSHVVEAAVSKGEARRIEVGSAWTFPAASKVELAGAAERADIRDVQGKLRVTPRVAGRFDFRVDGVADVRFAAIPDREIDLRTRAVTEKALGPSSGSTTAWVDLSRYVALVLLGLLAGEMVVRFLSARRNMQTHAT